MRELLKKQYPFLLHLAGAAVTFLTPSVLHWASLHPAYDVAIVALWGKLLHRAESPVTKP